MTAGPASDTGTLKDAAAHLIWAHAAGAEHVLELDIDGDGWNEPFTHRYTCRCGHDLAEWTQTEPEQTGCPDPADMLLAWHAHVASATGDGQEDTGQETNSAPETMTVTVRDRSREPAWGQGLTSPVTRTITISAFCPKDGQRRGEPQGRNECDDGAFYWIQVWDNPCGHVDLYEDVIKEAAALQARQAQDGAA